MKNGEPNEAIQKEIQRWELSFRYQLLDRMRMDCEYFLGYGGRHCKYLWAGNIEEQITYMRELWNSFAEEEKPVWLSMEQIDLYAMKMQPPSEMVTYSHDGECAR